MVKSKNKKSVIALVVMAFLLVASIVLAATGAWFTDKESGTVSGSITFGKIDLVAISDATITWSKETVLPGDTTYADVEVALGADSDDAFVKIVCTAPEALANGNVTFTVKDATNSENIIDLTNEVIPMQKNDKKVIRITVTVSTDLTNEISGTKYAGASLDLTDVSVKAFAVQQRNNSSSAAADQLTEAIQAYTAA